MTRAADTGVRALVSTTFTVVLASLPVFLIGATAVLIRAELGFDERALGVLIAAFYLASGVISVPGGAIGDAIGARRALLLTTAGTAVALVGVAAFAVSYWHLLVLMLVAGASQGTAQPASNLALSRAVDPDRMGFAFGLKQAAIPAATLIAGISIPVIALTLGWRAAFVLPALATLVVPFWLPQGLGTDRAKRPVTGTDSARGPLVVLAVAAGCGSAAAIALPSFLVEAAVARGVGAGVGGVILAVGSVVGIASRVVAGWRADQREGGHLLVVAGMLALGVVGYGILAVASHPVTFAVGAALGYAAGWGWPGLFVYAFVRLNPVATGAGTGIGQAGAMAGAMAGPILFGSVVAGSSYLVAWSVAAGLGALAAALVLVGRGWLLRLRRVR